MQQGGGATDEQRMGHEEDEDTRTHSCLLTCAFAKQ